METITTLYIAAGVFMSFSMFILVMVVSGKAILFEFYRRMVPKGCDVEIINSNRQVSHYYKVPKDGCFRIKGKTYITNPEKVMSLSEEVRENVQIAILDKKKRLDARIKGFEEKRDKVQKELKQLNKVAANTQKREQYKSYIESMDQKIRLIKKKTENREQLYYNRRRGKFYFIEGDPIPKDFHEFYTEMDSIAIDNIIARSMTNDPKAVADLEKKIKKMQIMILLTLGATILAIVLSVGIKTDLQTIAQNLGIALTL